MSALSKWDKVLSGKIAELDRRLFSHGDENYVPADRVFFIPFCGAVALTALTLLVELILKLEHRGAGECALWLLLAICGVNLLWHMKRIFAMPSLRDKLLYLAFLAGVSAAASFIFFAVYFWLFALLMLVAAAVAFGLIRSNALNRIFPRGSGRL